MGLLQGRARLYVAVLASLAGAIIGGCTGAAWESADAVLASLTIACAAFLLIRRIFTNTFDVFEPIVGGSIMLGLLFGLAPIYLMHDSARMYYLGYDIASVFTRALAIGLAGTVAFVLGYEVVGIDRTRKAPHFPSIDTFTIRIYAMVISALSMALMALRFSRSGGLPHLSSITEVASWAWLFPAIAIMAPRWGISGVALALASSSSVSLALMLGLAVRGMRHRAVPLSSVKEFGLAPVD